MRSSQVFPIAALAMLLASLPVAAQGTIAIHGASEADYQKWVQSADKAKARVVWVQAFGAGPLFNGIAVNDGTNHPSVSRHNLNAADYQKEFTEWTGKGYRPVSISGYTRGGATNFAVAFVKDGLPVTTEARHGQTSAEYNTHFAAMTKKGFRPIVVNGYAEGKSHRFVSIFINDGKQIVAHHDLTAADFQKRVDEHTPKGFRPTALNVYTTAQGPRFAAVFTKDNGPAYAIRHGLTAADYQKEFTSLTKNGFTPKQVVGYNSGGDRYAFIFEAPSKPVTYPLPMQGFTVAKYKPYDDAMQAFMKDRGFTGGTLAVRKGDILLHSRGYGYRDHGITP